jgi:hypothetical protein
MYLGSSLLQEGIKVNDCQLFDRYDGEQNKERQALEGGGRGKRLGSTGAIAARLSRRRRWIRAAAAVAVFAGVLLLASAALRVPVLAPASPDPTAVRPSPHRAMPMDVAGAQWVETRASGPQSDAPNTSSTVVRNGVTVISPPLLTDRVVINDPAFGRTEQSNAAAAQVDRAGGQTLNGSGTSASAVSTGANTRARKISVRSNRSRSAMSSRRLAGLSTERRSAYFALPARF